MIAQPCLTYFHIVAINLHCLTKDFSHHSLHQQAKVRHQHHQLLLRTVAAATTMVDTNNVRNMMHHTLDCKAVSDGLEVEHPGVVLKITLLSPVFCSYNSDPYLHWIIIIIQQLWLNGKTVQNTVQINRCMDVQKIKTGKYINGWWHTLHYHACVPSITYNIYKLHTWCNPILVHSKTWNTRGVMQSMSPSMYCLASVPFHTIATIVYMFSYQIVFVLLTQAKRRIHIHEIIIFVFQKWRKWQ